MEFDTGNCEMATPPAEAASSPPAMPAVNDASANAQILYRVVCTPAATALASLWRMAAHARPGLPRTCQAATANMTSAAMTQYR